MHPQNPSAQTLAHGRVLEIVERQHLSSEQRLPVGQRAEQVGNAAELELLPRICLQSIAGGGINTHSK